MIEICIHDGPVPTYEEVVVTKRRGVPANKAYFKNATEAARAFAAIDRERWISGLTIVQHIPNQPKELDVSGFQQRVDDMLDGFAEMYDITPNVRMFFSTFISSLKKCYANIDTATFADGEEDSRTPVLRLDVINATIIGKQVYKALEVTITFLMEDPDSFSNATVENSFATITFCVYSK